MTESRALVLSSPTEICVPSDGGPSATGASADAFELVLPSLPPSGDPIWLNYVKNSVRSLAASSRAAFAISPQGRNRTPFQ